MNNLTMNSVKIFVFIWACIAFSTAIQVAVIGGGIGGASSAYFLKTMYKDELNIDLYEANKIGGRLATVEHDGKIYENGGSVIHEKNFYMSKFVEEFGLEKIYDCAQTFAVFDGPLLVFQSSNYTILTLLKFLWKYGLNIFRLDMFVKNLINLFSRAYKLVDNMDYPFESTYEMLGNIDKSFMNLVNISAFNGFCKEGFSEEFIHEIIGPIILCNYCQTTSIHHFVGSVAVAGSGSTLWSVKGGNWQVANNLILYSGAKIIQERVTSISPVNQSSKIMVSTSNNDNLYDYVIVATPLTINNNIDLNQFGKRTHDVFHTTICTFVKGELNQNYFSTYGQIVPGTLLFAPGFIVNAMSKVHDVFGNCDDNSLIWKIFSDRSLQNVDLEILFKDHSIISETEWQAYPHYYSQSENKSFYLFENVKNLLYVNAIETLASAMEMSIIGAHNVASLVIKNIYDDVYVNPFTKNKSHDEL